MVRTRFAPSPTGYLHIGGARTALFSWAYARKHGGKFLLRIEDTDLERSTESSVQAILDAMRWLGLDWDEGPFFQLQRLARYKEVADGLIEQGKAYRCWATKEELDAMRERQRARGEKPRYDGRWRPERAKAAGLVPPADRLPVVRFRNPDEGDVVFHDVVKGSITVSNAELDDLVLLRADGVPTYNFGVVVDDLDMNITHVIRGDDHVNNTPRQVNIFQALGARLPKALVNGKCLPIVGRVAVKQVLHHVRDVGTALVRAVDVVVINCVLGEMASEARTVSGFRRQREFVQQPREFVAGHVASPWLADASLLGRHYHICKIGKVFGMRRGAIPRLPTSPATVRAPASHR